MSKKFGSFLRVEIHVWTNLGHSNSSTSPSQEEGFEVEIR